jgi:Putative collagen-binding domain of a collagenase
VFSAFLPLVWIEFSHEDQLMNRRKFLAMTAGAVGIMPLSPAAKNARSCFAVSKSAPGRIASSQSAEGMVAGLMHPSAPIDSRYPASTAIMVPLEALSTNPHYFTDGSGKAIYLTGSQTWNTLQDWGTNGSVQPLDFTAFVDMLVSHHHNFTLLWTTELPKVHALPSTASSPPDFTVAPFPWQRTGPGNATDGKLKFDLTKFNPPFFQRLRDRVRQLHAAGIYAGVYLFTGEFINMFRSPTDGYPFTGSNNVNGIDDGGGIASVTMTAPNAITAFQDTYIKKMIDTLNDLPNVLWIVSEEAPANSVWWNNHLIALVHSYEAGKSFQHPVGYAVRHDNDDASIIDSDADWIAPFARISSASTCSSGHPRCKVNVNDSDHSYFGMWNDSPRVNRNFFWINFTQGSQTLFMDPYLVFYPRQSRNLPRPPIVNGIGSGPDPRWENVRKTMGYIRGYADRMNLAAMTPQGSLSSTGHVLASADAANPEFLVYAPTGGKCTVNLPSSRGRIAVEWMNPATGAKTTAADVDGGATRTFTPPFNGDAVLYLRVL